ncbi:MAG: hypothetical protein EBZ59_04000 [Planctomycetia bacterium]|nr:hypothetical protein [Planctomycetia bacterium]
MAEPITCICGYRGPGVLDRHETVCPICRTPARDLADVGSSAPTPAASSTGGGPAAGAAAAEPPHAAAGHRAATGGDPGARPSKPEIFHIPCPRGHVLKAAKGMIDQQVVCPSCNEFFVLRIADSLEYRREMRRQQEEKEAKQAEAWLRWAIMATVFVVASFLAMIAIRHLLR